MMIATIVCSARPPCTVRLGTSLGYLSKELRDVPKRGVAICIKNCTFWNVVWRWKC